MARRGAYLYKRKGSDNYWLRLVYPAELEALYGRKRVERSLRTSNKVEAEAAAGEEIRRHKLALLAAQRAREGKSQPMGLQKRYPPGSTNYVGDFTVVALENDLIYLDRQQKHIRTEPNAIEVDLRNTLEYALTDTTKQYLTPMTREAVRKFASHIARGNDPDLAMFERWINKNKVKPHIKSDAINVLRLFQETAGRPIRICRNYEAVSFVDRLAELGLSDKTISKKISYLSAMCNIAVIEEVLERNIFRGVAPKIRKNWETARLCLSEDQMQTVREHLHELSEEDRLLWMLLATTGMRLSEPFEVKSEEVEDGHRFIMVGTKTLASRRRIPIPDQIAQFLPQKITGPLFSDSSETHGKRLRYFLRKHGISYDSKKNSGDKRFTVHSLRHRAATRLRAARCREEVREELLGHQLVTIADGYGKGSPVALLKKWQASIGF